MKSLSLIMIKLPDHQRSADTLSKSPIVSVLLSVSYYLDQQRFNEVSEQTTFYLPVILYSYYYLAKFKGQLNEPGNKQM